MFAVTVEQNGQQTNIFLVYDGPEHFSPTVKKTRDKHYVCSTFQCLLKILHKPGQQVRFDYNTILINPNTEMMVNQLKQVTLPNASCFHSPCLLMIHVREGSQFHVNISIKEISWEGRYPEGSDCMYFGVLAVEKEGNKLKESETVCENFKAHNYLSRSFYSQNTSLGLLLYWYEPYSFLSVRAVVDKTECSVAVLNFISLEKFCGQSQTLKTCNHFLANISHSIRMFNEHSHSDWAAATDIVYISVPKLGCGVVQLRHTVNGQPNQIPHRTVYHSSFSTSVNSEVGFDITFKVLGVWTQYQTRKRYERLAFYKNDFTSELCRLYPQNNTGGCDLEEHDAQHRIASSNYADVHFYWLTKFSTPIAKDSFFVQLFLGLHTNSWVDIQIHMQQVHGHNDKINKELDDLYKHENLFMSDAECDESTAKCSESKIFRDINFLWLLSFHCVEGGDNCIGKKWNIVMTVEWQGLKHNELESLKTQWCVGYTLDKYFSAPGKLQFLELDASQIPKIHRHTYFMKLHWIHDNYKSLSYLTDVKISKCSKIAAIRSETHDCQNFTPIHHLENKYYLLFWLSNEKFKGNFGERFLAKEGDSTVVNNNFISWKRSEALCSDVGGSLPYFLSKSDLEEFVTVLKFSGIFPSVREAYMGLTSNGEKRVSW